MGHSSLSSSSLNRFGDGQLCGISLILTNVLLCGGALWTIDLLDVGVVLVLRPAWL